MSGWQQISELRGTGLPLPGFATHDTTLDEILAHDPTDGPDLFFVDCESFCRWMDTEVWPSWRNRAAT